MVYVTGVLKDSKANVPAFFVLKIWQMKAPEMSCFRTDWNSPMLNSWEVKNQIKVTPDPRNHFSTLIQIFEIGSSVNSAIQLKA